jgi:hypothetical protein
VRSEFTDDVSEFPVGPIFTGKAKKDDEMNGVNPPTAQSCLLYVGKLSSRGRFPRY